LSIVLFNANVYLHDGADTVIIKNGVIEYVGRYENVAGKLPSLKTIDCQGRLVIPALTDTHMHLLGLAKTKTWLDLRGTRSIKELKKKISQAARKKQWILGRGWDQELFEEKRLPNRWDLDEAAKEKPAIIVRVCGHLAVLNTKALKLTGLLDNIPPNLAGYVEVVDGKPTGVIVEDAVDYVFKHVPEPAKEELKNAMRKVLEEAASYGLAELHAMSATAAEIEIYEEISKPWLPQTFFYATLEDAPTLKSSRVIGVKVFMDGSFGARTAWLRQPYSDDLSTKGKKLLDHKKLATIARSAAKQGLQVAAHAIGDAAVEEATKTVEREGLKNLRIEHASLTPPDLIERLSQNKIPVSVQPHFIITDWWIVQRLGAERARWVYAYKSLIEAGITIGASSDAPVEPLNPWKGVYAAIDRGRNEGLPIFKASPNEALKPEEALNLYLGGPMLRNSQPRRISEGQKADLVIVDAFDVESIVKTTQVVATIISGRIAYKSAYINIE